MLTLARALHEAVASLTRCRNGARACHHTTDTHMTTTTCPHTDLADWLLLRRVVHLWLTGKRGLGGEGGGEAAAARPPISHAYWLSWLHGTEPSSLTALYT